MYDVTLVCDDDKQLGDHKNVKSISSTSILIECVRCDKYFIRKRDLNIHTEIRTRVIYVGKSLNVIIVINIYTSQQNPIKMNLDESRLI